MNKVGGAFVQDLKQQKGRHQKPGIDFGTGEVWSGIEARTIGLVDEIGTMETVVGNKVQLKQFNFGPHDRGFENFGGRFIGEVLTTLGDFQYWAPLQFR